MKVTEIRKLPTGGIRLLLDDDRKLRVTPQIVADFSLFPGKELSPEEMALLEKAASLSAAKERAIRIVSSTNISRQKLTRRLREKGESPEFAEAAVQWLDSYDLLDDRRAGESVVRSALNKGYGERRIRQILWEKEIPKELWEELLSDLPPMDAMVDKLLRQKIKSPQPDEKEVRRAVDSLLRYGHTWQDIRAGLERMHADLDLEDPECQ